MKHILPITLLPLVILVSTVFPSIIHAQAIENPISSGIATYVQITDRNVPEGSIVSFTDKGYSLSKVSYDPSVFGVVTDNPQVALEATNLPEAKPVISLGKVYVRVSSANGTIKEGDLITTSERAGVGQKAIDDGYILGTAAESYDEKDASKTGSILVVLNIGFNTRPTTITNNLLETLRKALSAPSVSPLNALRYVLAVMIVLIAFIFGLHYFGRVSRTGVEAIGRNPLARRSIMAGILLNLILATSVIVIAIVTAYFVLIL